MRLNGLGFGVGLWGGVVLVGGGLEARLGLHFLMESENENMLSGRAAPCLMPSVC